jgi:hypothetical protein
VQVGKLRPPCIHNTEKKKEGHLGSIACYFDEESANLAIYMRIRLHTFINGLGIANIDGGLPMCVIQVPPKLGCRGRDENEGGEALALFHAECCLCKPTDDHCWVGKPMEAIVWKQARR